MRSASTAAASQRDANSASPLDRTLHDERTETGLMNGHICLNRVYERNGLKPKFSGPKTGEFLRCRFPRFSGGIDLHRAGRVPDPRALTRGRSGIGPRMTQLQHEASRAERHQFGPKALQRANAPSHAQQIPTAATPGRRPLSSRALGSEVYDKQARFYLLLRQAIA